MPDRRRRRDQPARLVAAVPPWVVMAAALAVMAAVVAYLTRGTTVYFDEWAWIAERRSGGVDAFLEGHNGHLSLVPVAVYRLLYATAGLASYWPYRAAIIVAHLAVCALVYVYAARRLGGWGALVAAGAILVLGPAWQNILWPFQVGYLASLGAGVGAFLLLDRRDRAGDAGASALLGVALASSGLGVPIAAGVAAELAFARRLRSWWVVAVPVALYGLWFLAYREGTQEVNVGAVPLFAVEAAAGALSALLGLSGSGLEQEAEVLQWGRPLAIVGVVLLGWRLRRLGGASPRVLGLLTVAATFWLLTGLQREFISSPTASRYLYVGALVVVLVAAELLPRVSLGRGARLVVAGAVALVAVANLAVLADRAQFLRGEGARTRAALGALDLARPVVRPGEVAGGLPGYPVVRLEAGEYYAAADELGRAAVADTPATLAAAPEVARRFADAELLRLHGGPLQPARASARARGGAAPAVEGAAGGTLRRTADGCVTFRAPGAGPADAVSELRLAVPPSGVLVRAVGGDVDVAVRRFAAGFREPPSERIRAGAAAVVDFRPDLAEQPWHLRLVPQRAVEVCSRPRAAGAQG